MPSCSRMASCIWDAGHIAGAVSMRCCPKARAARSSSMRSSWRSSPSCMRSIQAPANGPGVAGPAAAAQRARARSDRGVAADEHACDATGQFAGQGADLPGFAMDEAGAVCHRWRLSDRQSCLRKFDSPVLHRKVQLALQRYSGRRQPLFAASDLRGQRR